MKRMVRILIVLILLGASAIVLKKRTGEAPEPSFRLYSSFSSSTRDTRETRIDVITRRRDKEAVYTEVEEFFNNMNGVPDKLTIYLYPSEGELMRGESSGIKEFEYHTEDKSR